MNTANSIRLRKLYQLYSQVCDAILGHPLEDRAELLRLKKTVVAEIKEIEQSDDLRLKIPA